MLSLAQLTARQDAYLAAEMKILQSQEYQVGHSGTARKNRRADLAEVRAQLDVLAAQIAAHPENSAAQAARRANYRRMNP